MGQRGWNIIHLRASEWEGKLAALDSFFPHFLGTVEIAGNLFLFFLKRNILPLKRAILILETCWDLYSFCWGSFFVLQQEKLFKQTSVAFVCLVQNRDWNSMFSEGTILESHKNMSDVNIWREIPSPKFGRVSTFIINVNHGVERERNMNAIFKNKRVSLNVQNKKSF